MNAWTSLPSHRTWLARHLEQLFEFGRRTPAPGGGAYWLGDDGTPWPDRGLHTWITGRTAHVYSLGALLGIPGCRPVARAALQGLAGPLHDDEAGGWFSSVGPDGSHPDEKAAYSHAFVVLAASSATVAGLPTARELLDRALAAMAARFWDESAGMVVDTWDAGFAHLDGYRGINANMHTVEAFLAASDVTGDEVWLERASRIGAFAASAARANSWRLPEHYDAGWAPRPAFNADRPDDWFKPYGATVGPGLEWSRLLLQLESAGARGSDWSGAAIAMYDRAVADGWASDGNDGFVYTTDWTGTPVVRTRMHWVVAEAINTAAALHARTGEMRFAEDYGRWWDYAARYVIDHDRGSWHHELDSQNVPSSAVWPGKADLYHAAQATLIPRLPLAPSLATALGRGSLG